MENPLPKIRLKKLNCPKTAVSRARPWKKRPWPQKRGIGPALAGRSPTWPPWPALCPSCTVRAGSLSCVYWNRQQIRRTMV